MDESRYCVADLGDRVCGMDLTHPWHRGQGDEAHDFAPPSPPEVDQPSPLDVDQDDATEDHGAGEPPASRRILPDEFWEARPVLRHIRQAAHARNRSSNVVLGGILARLASMLPPALKADTGVGSPASANLFVALIGASGRGKSSGAWIPRELLPTPIGLDIREDLPLGSGEGLAEAYMGEEEVETGDIHTSGPKKHQAKTERRRIQVRGNALFYADEGESLTKQLFGRNGTTIGESLRRAWTGGTLGQFNGKQINTRIVAAGSYSLGLVIGFQRKTVLPLLEDADAGTPQRFLWVETVDPSIPFDPVDSPGPLHLSLFTEGFDLNPRFTFAANLLRDIRCDDWERATGRATLPLLDAHKPLMLVKLSVLLAVLDSRTDVTVEDWELADAIWSTSCAVRDHAIDYGARERAKELESRTRLHVDREVRAYSAKAATERGTERVARRIGRLVRDAGWMTPGALRKATAHRDRALFDDALDYAESRGWITVEDEKITPGDSVPS